MKKSSVILLAFFVCLLWGTLYPMVKVCYNELNIVGIPSILLLVGVRFSVCGGAVTLFCFKKKSEKLAAVKGDFWMILAVGLFAIILHYGFKFAAMAVADSGRTAIVGQIGTLLYVCFSFLFFKDDKFSIKKVVAVLLGFIGVIVINLGSSGSGSLIGLGDVLVLISAVFYLASIIISKKVYSRVDDVVVTGVNQLFGGIVMLFAGICMGGTMSLREWYSGYALVYVCVASIASYVIWGKVLNAGLLSKLFIIKFAEPVFACIFGAILLGEDIFKLQYLFAFLIIAAGIVLSEINFGKKSQTSTEAVIDEKSPESELDKAPAVD